MKTMFYSSLIILFFFFTGISVAQSPEGKNFGFGFILGEPTGGTAKFWTSRENSFVLSLGQSYFGSPRIGLDYLWQFNPFTQNYMNLFAGAGGAIGFGDGGGLWSKHKYARTGNEIGFAARAIFGINYIPPHTPLETFFELGVLMSLIPDVNSGIDAGLGIRFYP